MKPAKKYASAGALRRALEDRLRKIAATANIDLARLRRQVAFDRLLARLFHSDDAPWVLKGGYAMELQLRVARTTVDIDLTLPASLSLSPEEAPATAPVREMLQEAASLDLGDWFIYTVGAPMMDLDAAPYGGARYSIECRMDGRTFSRFHLDVGTGDVLIPPLQKIQGHDWLGFAEIPVAEMRLISKEQQVAEKLHAYTLPRSTPNSRVKDLVDLLLLIRTGEVRGTRLTKAVRMTFERRKTHAIPSALVPPPESWETRFRALATECGLASDMEDSFREVGIFLDQVLRSAKVK
jgi:Nucleotidyl transferase AbiEii toxin, Type IV TA system